MSWTACSSWVAQPQMTLKMIRYIRENSFALQATTACGAYRWVVVSYRRYKYYNDLSEELPVINDTSTMTT